MNCTRCSGTGFLNLEQVSDEALTKFNETGDHTVILDWIDEMDANRIKYGCSCHLNPPCYSCVEYLHDVAMCDCCSDGDDWYGTPGEHHGGPNEPIPGCV